MRTSVILLASLLCVLSLHTWGETLVPKYKPSSRAPEAIDITSNRYGFSRTAPDALEIGDTPANFTLERAGGGTVTLAQKLKTGPVVLIFYRGHW